LTSIGHFGLGELGIKKNNSSNAWGVGDNAWGNVLLPPSIDEFTWASFYALEVVQNLYIPVLGSGSITSITWTEGKLLSVPFDPFGWLFPICASLQVQNLHVLAGGNANDWVNEMKNKHGGWNWWDNPDFLPTEIYNAAADITLN
jgi:hypothetical protein